MADKSGIEWTDATWNPIRGCTRVSPGCGGPGPHGGCYAERQAARFSAPGKPYHGLAEMRGGKARWTGAVTFGHDLEAPLRWRRKRRIFVNSMSDLFHEGLAPEEIATVYAICAAAHAIRGHTLQILTKRSGRMRAILNDDEFWQQVNAEIGMHVMEYNTPLDRSCGDARATVQEYGPGHPPPGIWLGVSAENQEWADKRVPDLQATPAALRWVSAEPLMSGIRFDRIPVPESEGRLHNALYGHEIAGMVGQCVGWVPPIDWIVAGDESGPNRRAVDHDDVRAIRDQCAHTRTPFYLKQLHIGGKKISLPQLDGRTHDAFPLAA